MRRMLYAVAVVLCTSLSQAAPPSIEPELATWYDSWHDAQERLIFPVERSLSTGQIINYSYQPYENVCRRQLYDIMVDPTASLAARYQAKVIYGHFGLWPRGISPVIDVP